MTRWTAGEVVIEELLREKRLQRVQGGQANGNHLLERAGRTLATASAVAREDPDSAYVLAYDAARYAATALLAHQGLRPTTSGGHYVVEVAIRAQFGPGFRTFGALRRRRHELEYPTGPGEATNQQEAADAIADARAVLDAARLLITTLGLF